MKKTILITGGAGFIGSNAVLYFLRHYPEYRIVTLDALTYAGNTKNIAEVMTHPRHRFIHGDICDRALVEDIFLQEGITDVLHFAAESHVDNSIASPDIFVRTNVHGTFTLLDVARKYWKSEKNRFHHISTDEVYGTLGETGYFTEKTPYAPNSPYAASKAASDMLVRSYHHTYGMNTVITNCSNNYGPRQHAEKLIPTIISSALSSAPIPIYGTGKNIRDWLHVDDHCRGIDCVFHKGISGGTYNIGGNNERENIDIARTICDILDEKKPRSDGKSYHEQIAFVRDRAGHDFRYAIDSTKLRVTLGWKAKEEFSNAMKKTVEWYLAHPSFLEKKEGG